MGLDDLGVQTAVIAVNDSSFDDWITGIAPDVVIFDRFMTEEQFGWRVAKQCPDALRVLDTSDLHCLRVAREKSLKDGAPPKLHNETAVREIASIYRSDLTLMISEYEMQILKDTFGIVEPLVAYWPFSMTTNQAPMPDYEMRQHCIMIGSFMHPPNLDAARWCKREIWPLVRKRLPHVELHCYGSYGDKYTSELHAPDKGFHFKGRAEDALKTMAKYRLNLATLRYGAGLKGKVFDGFATETPTIMTPVAAEGICDTGEWGGAISDDPQVIADAIVELYTDAAQWKETQCKEHATCQSRFNQNHWIPKLPNILEAALAQIDQAREANFIGQMLNHHHHRSTEFMSRWIEAKNG